MLNDFPEGFFVAFTVEDCQSDASVTEASRSPDSVHVALVVRVNYPVIRLNGHIKVDDKLDLAHVEPARQQIRCNDGVDLTLPELLYVLISLFFGHLTEDDGTFVAVVLKLIEKELRILKGIYENDGLCVLSESIIDIFDEVNLSLRLTFVEELLNVVKFKSLYLEADLDRLIENFGYFL